MTFKKEGEPPPALPNDDKGPLVVREWSIVPATAIGPGRSEYNDVLGDEILSHIRALRDQSTERSLALAKEALVPFGYGLDSRFDAGWNRTFWMVRTSARRWATTPPLALPGLATGPFASLKRMVQISDSGQVLPTAHEQVFHYNCCKAAIHDVELGPDPIRFHAPREGIWYFVEAGTRASSEMADRADEELALQSPVDFFEYLSARRYDEASQLYGGSYEVLIDNNPTLDPQDHAALLRNACTANGFQCLRVQSARLQDQVMSRAEFRFLVAFCTRDGGLCIRGPCQGASKTEMPSQSEFLLAVVQSENEAFRVQDPPVYVPQRIPAPARWSGDFQPRQDGDMACIEGPLGALPPRASPLRRSAFQTRTLPELDDLSVSTCRPEGSDRAGSRSLPPDDSFFANVGTLTPNPDFRLTAIWLISGLGSYAWETLGSNASKPNGTRVRPQHTKRRIARPRLVSAVKHRSFSSARNRQRFPAHAAPDQVSRLASVQNTEGEDRHSCAHFLVDTHLFLFYTVALADRIGRKLDFRSVQQNRPCCRPAHLPPFWRACLSGLSEITGRQIAPALG
jgi:hypothetical protein